MVYYTLYLGIIVTNHFGKLEFTQKKNRLFKKGFGIERVKQELTTFVLLKLLLNKFNSYNIV